MRGSGHYHVLSISLPTLLALDWARETSCVCVCVEKRSLQNNTECVCVCTCTGSEKHRVCVCVCWVRETSYVCV